MLHHSRKGAVEIQFNWILVLIIGAMILAFFFSVASKQKALSEKKIGAELTAELDLLFTGQGVSSNTISEMDIPNTPIMMSCEDYSVFGVPRRLGNTILFSPDAIEGKSMVGFTTSWTVPYRVTNFFYLTTPAVKYYFVGAEDQLREELEELLPEQLDAEFIAEDGVASLEYQNNPHVTFVFFKELEAVPVLLQKAKDSAVTAVQLQGGLLSLDSFNQAMFYQKKGLSWNMMSSDSGLTAFPVIEQAGVLGAIFSTSPQRYECGMDRALQKLKHIASIISQRASSLAAQRPDCSVLEENDILPSMASDAGDLPAAKRIVEQAKNGLPPRNQNALRSSCPTLY